MTLRGKVIPAKLVPVLDRGLSSILDRGRGGTLIGDRGQTPAGSGDPGQQKQRQAAVFV